MNDIVKRLTESGDLSDEDFKKIILSDEYDADLFRQADIVRRGVYGTDVYLRGLIEFTNICKNDCYYCGLRCSNSCAERYRLDKDTILMCCREGYSLGYRTFVLQGGEDPFFTDEKICDIVGSIREEYSDCAITLSIGEKSRESYKKYYEAGANRYLLRHETANEEHYKKLHPQWMKLENRKRCLFDLKELGYQVGAGFMVGSPYQTVDNLVEDLRFLQKLNPDMIGIGPFIHNKDTPFKSFPDGSAQLTIRMLAVLRLMFPHVLLPATTALGTILPNGRELGLKAGANVIMPNLSPFEVRKKYTLYDNKICVGDESAQSKEKLDRRVEAAGYHTVTDKGDVKR